MPTEYDKLKKIWYKKLKQSGFEDIELNEYGDLKEPTSVFRLSRNSTVVSEARIAYYDMATQFLNDYAFVSHLERIIWEYHSNGISSRNIAKLLTKARRKKMNRMKVWRTIKRLQKLMKSMYMR